MRLLAALGLGLLAACGSSGTRVDWEPSRSPAWVGIGDGDQAVRAELVRARIALEGGRPEQAADMLRALCEREPSNLGAARMLQDARLAAGEQREELAAEARAKATGDVYGEPFAPLLAARLEDDPAAARLLIERPLAETGVSLAAPGLGRAFRASARRHLAWLALEEGDGSTARSQLEAALDLDPGHFGGRRLEAHLLRGEGDLVSARAHLTHWLELTAAEPTVPSDRWYESVLDLAILSTELDRLGDAADELERLLEPRPGTAGWGAADEATQRRGRLLAAVLAVEGGRPERALELARRAREGLDRGSALYGLSLVQEAELLELFLGRPEEAALVWEEVIERFGAALDGGGLAAGGDSEFDELLRVLAARVRLSRLERDGHGAPDSPGSPGATP